MKDLEALKRTRNGFAVEMRGMLDTAETRDDKAFTPEEETRYNDFAAKLTAVDAEIERETQLQAAENRSAADKPPEQNPDDFRNFGTFLTEARFNPGSTRLQSREVGNTDSRDMTMGNGPSAGFLVPEQFDPRLHVLQTPDPAIFRPRSMVIPAGSPPDAAINLNALDQNSTLGVYSGVVVRWIAENATRQDAGDPQVRQIKIEPQEVSGYIDLSDKLLRNSDAAGALATNLLRSAITGSEEDTFFTGSGVGQPLGVVGHPSTIATARATANQISYADVSGMYARAKFGGSYTWIASQTVLPQLMAMVDAGNNLVWQPNAREGIPGTLLGIPVVFNDQSPTLGSLGDLALVDLQYYAIKDGSPLAIFIDPYTQKVNGVSRIYAFWNVDGQPMLTTPMLQRDGVNTVSPFVLLAA